MNIRTRNQTPEGLHVYKTRRLRPRVDFPLRTWDPETVLKVEVLICDSLAY